MIPLEVSCFPLLAVRLSVFGFRAARILSTNRPLYFVPYLLRSHRAIFRSRYRFPETLVLSALYQHG